MKNKPLEGFRALVTSGPTHEPVDPVRFLGNHSSGKQGHAIAVALRDAGASVTLITGPVSLADPEDMKVKHVVTADDMLDACTKSLPVDIAVCAAAVSDWKVLRVAKQKIKKTGNAAPSLELVENPDILATLSKPGLRRPQLVIGFAAETERVVENAARKLKKKRCDWIVANDVTDGQGFNAQDNEVMLLRNGQAEIWPRMSKKKIATKLVKEITKHLGAQP